MTEWQKAATIAKAFKAVNVELYWAQKRINLLILAHVDFDLKKTDKVN